MNVQFYQKKKKKKRKDRFGFLGIIGGSPTILTSPIIPTMHMITFNVLDHTKKIGSTTIIFNGVENDGDKAKNS